MATWITIQTSDLYDYLCAPQLNALKNFELADDQSNPIEKIINDVVSRIRAEISGNQNNYLSANKTSIPHDLKSFACYLILENAQTRFPSLKLTADQVRLANDAKEYLRRISLGEIPVSIPDDAISTSDFSKNSGCEVVSNRKRHTSIKSLSGF